MSLIPYSPRDSDSQEIVLRHQSTLVVHDPVLGQLALRNLSPTEGTVDTISVCPYCHRPITSSQNGDTVPPSSVPNLDARMEPGFVDQNYFRMLEGSHREKLPTRESLSSSHAKPQSPTRRRLPHPARVDDSDEKSSPAAAQNARHGHSAEGISSGAFSPGYFQRFFVSEGELGRGGNGVVLLVRHVLDGVSLGHFACKRVPVGNNHKWLEKVLKEVQLLQQLSHSNLVSYRHVWLESVQITKFGPEVPCAFILQQYCNAGDLHQYVLKSSTSAASLSTSNEALKNRMRRRSRGQPDDFEGPPCKLKFELIMSFFQDIAAGLNHLHLSGFIHRDLKPQNCLLTDPQVPGHPPKVLVSDFGEVQMESATRSSTGATGTISYCAPEVLQRGPNGQYGNFSTKSDVFSLGMILHFMCFGRLPYNSADSANEENEDLDKLRAEISTWEGLVSRQTTRRPDLPEQLYVSLERLLSPVPSQRPSVEEILAGLHALNTVGEESLPTKRTGSLSTPDSLPDAHIFRRISPIADTPPASSPRSISPKHRHQKSVKDSYKSFGSNTLHPARSSRLRPSPVEPESGNSHEQWLDQDLTHSAEISTNSPNVPSGSSLILRPTIESCSSPSKQSASLSHKDKHLSEETDGALFFSFRVAIYLAKVWSISRHCIPLAPNPWAFYPLITLATLDIFRPSLRKSILTAVLHIIILYFFKRRGTLCLLF